MSTKKDGLTIGSFLLRKSDKVGARIVEHGGGSHDWFDIEMENSRIVTISASGIRSKYIVLSPSQNRIAYRTAERDGFTRGMVAGVISAFPLSAHSLMNEGAPFRDDGERENFGLYRLGVGGPGRAKCSCGVLSEPLTTSVARRTWHRAHKLESAS